jgi:hypothetical protein
METFFLLLFGVQKKHQCRCGSSWQQDLNDYWLHVQSARHILCHCTPSPWVWLMWGAYHCYSWPLFDQLPLKGPGCINRKHGGYFDSLYHMWRMLMWQGATGWMATVWFLAGVRGYFHPHSFKTASRTHQGFLPSGYHSPFWAIKHSRHAPRAKVSNGKATPPLAHVVV